LFTRIVIKGSEIYIISSDPSKFVSLGAVVVADRFADVRPICRDGTMYWVVIKDGRIYGECPTREDALRLEMEVSKCHKMC